MEHFLYAGTYLPREAEILHCVHPGDGQWLYTMVQNEQILSWMLLYLVQSGGPFSPLYPDQEQDRPLTLSELLKYFVTALPLGTGCCRGPNAQRRPARGQRTAAAAARAALREEPTG